MPHLRQALTHLLALASLGLVANGFVVPATKFAFSVQTGRPAPTLFSEVADAVDSVPETNDGQDPQADPAEAAVEDEQADAGVAADGSEEQTEAADTAAAEPATAEPEERFSIYINNLPFEITTDELKEFCEKAGTVTNLNIPKRRGTQVSRGFAFVDFASKEEMEKAVADLDDTQLGGRVLSVSVSVPKEQLPDKEPRSRVSKEERDERKIYVGNLPYGIDKDVIVNHFSQKGEVEYVYIARDGNNQDRGFGFVTMKNVEDVASTIEALDGTELEGREIAARKPMDVVSKTANGEVTRIYFGNIAFETTLDTMQQLFEEHGKLLNIFITEDRATGRSRGFGFAMMSTSDAEKAIEELDGIEVDGRPIKVTKAEDREKTVKNTRIYCGNLSWETDEDGVRSMFEEYGSVLDLYYATNQMGTPRGFAIVTMEPDAAKEAITALDGAVVDGRDLKVNEAKPKGSQPRKMKIYVGNLSFDTPADTIRETFEEYGPVHECFLPEDYEFGGSRGFGFVVMDMADAEAAIDELNGIELDGRSIRVVEAEEKGPGRRSRNDDFGDDDQF